ncbi:MAG: integration host factor subunit alpha [Deltaproteobacteria bacterium]|nr:integration host factor subunit alpha [Deltaproteobacteria bacterium]MBZ0219821.1 integration host factor subunit alpha [Deltaproteobacteria bacterium]
MTKADIVEIVFEKVGFSKKDVSTVIEEIFETIKTTLESGEKVKISGFGNFTIRQKRARRGRNPQTGSEITIEERRVMTFKASQLLKKAINQGAPAQTPTAAV